MKTIILMSFALVMLASCDTVTTVDAATLNGGARQYTPQGSAAKIQVGEIREIGMLPSRVAIMNPDGIRGEKGIHMPYGSGCMVLGGTVAAVGMDGSDVLVRYGTRRLDTLSPCVDGTLFFMTIDAFAHLPPVQREDGIVLVDHLLAQEAQ